MSKKTKKVARFQAPCVSPKASENERSEAKANLSEQLGEHGRGAENSALHVKQIKHSNRKTLEEWQKVLETLL